MLIVYVLIGNATFLKLKLTNSTACIVIFLKVFLQHSEFRIAADFGIENEINEESRMICEPRLISLLPQAARGKMTLKCSS